MKNSVSLPRTQNAEWGFYGSMSENADKAWDIALVLVSEATGESLETVAVFLDSRHGRHFADDCLNAIHDGSDIESAVKISIEKWMNWTIGKAVSKTYGIPAGLSYLMGFVIHADSIA